MNAVRFINHFAEVAKKLKDSNFTGSELAKLALEASVKLEELEFKDREISLATEKTRQEIELATLKAKSEVAFTMSEALKSVVQAECMILGVRDNANINKCNALVAYMNTLGNASNVSSLTKELQTEILLTIKAIGEHIGDPNSYDMLLSALKNKADALLGNKDSVREVFIHTPRLEVQANERVQLLGFSIFNQSECRFRFGGKEVVKIEYNTEQITQAKKDLQATNEAITLATTQINTNKQALATSSNADEKTKITQAIEKLETQKKTHLAKASEQEATLKALISQTNATSTGQIIEGKTMIYSSEHKGYTNVIFEAKNELGEWISDIVRLEVRDI